MSLESSSNSNATTTETETPAEDVIHEGVQNLLQGSSLKDYNKNYLETFGQNSLMARASAAEMLALLDPANKATCIALIMRKEESYR